MVTDSSGGWCSGGWGLQCSDGKWSCAPVGGAPVVGGSGAPVVGCSGVIMNSAPVESAPVDSFPMVGCSGAPAESAPVQHLGIKALVWSGMARLVNLWYRETRGQSLVTRDNKSIFGSERQ